MREGGGKRESERLRERSIDARAGLADHRQVLLAPPDPGPCGSSRHLPSSRCRSNMAHIRQSRPDSGLGLESGLGIQVKVLETVAVVHSPSSPRASRLSALWFVPIPSKEGAPSKSFNNFYPKAKARIWPSLTCLCLSSSEVLFPHSRTSASLYVR